MENTSSTVVAPINYENYSDVALWFRAFCEPLLCVLSLIGNIAVLIGMARVKSGFSDSIRFYYSVYSMAELVLVAGYYFIGDFLEVGVAYLVNGGTKFFILTYNANDWTCKFFNALWMGTDYVIGMTLVCLGIERVIAITWPLRAKMILKLRNSVIFEAAINIMILGGFLPLLLMVYTKTSEYGCWYDFALPFTEFFILLEEGIPLLNSFLSFCISAYLIFKIISIMLARNHISTNNKVTASEISNIFTLLLLDIAHLIVYIPNSVFYWIYSLMEKEHANSGLTLTFINLADISDELILIPHALTFFIHFFRSRVFRKALFGKCS